MRLPTLGIVTLGLLLGGLSVAQEDGKKELDRLQGTWTATDVQINGKKITDDDIKRMSGGKETKVRLIVEGKTVRFLGRKGTLKIDPTKNPKEIDLSAEAPDKGGTIIGIYAIEKGGLKLCLNMDSTDAESAKKRPKEFAAEKDSFRGLFILKREKK